MDHELRALIERLDGFDRIDHLGRLDANNTAFLARELEQHRNLEFDVNYPASRTLTFLPVATDIDPLAKTFSWNVWDRAGRAKVVTGDSTDIPRVSVTKEEQTGRLHWIASSFGYSLFDMRRASRFGVPLDNKLQIACAKAIDFAIDEILRTGTSASSGQSLGLVGFLNATAVDKNPGTLHNWFDPDTTAQNMVDDLELIVYAPADRTKDIYRPDTLLMASALYKLVAAKRFSSDASVTALQAFLSLHPEIRQVDRWTALNTAGDSSKHRIVAYPQTKEVIEAVVPVRYEQLPSQVDGLEYSTIAFGACGGVQIYQPAAMQYADLDTSFSES